MDTTEGSDPTEKDAVADIKPEESDNPLIQSVLQDLVDLDKDYMELEVWLRR
jgi:hypothetical protein